MAIVDPVDHRRVTQHVKGLANRLERLRAEHGPRTAEEIAATTGNTAAPVPASAPTEGSTQT